MAQLLHVWVKNGQRPSKSKQTSTNFFLIKENVVMNWWKKYGDKVGMGCFQEGPYVQQPHALTYISLHVVYNYFVLNFIESVWVYFHAMLKHSYPNGQFLSTPHVGRLVPRPCPSLRESGSGNGELRKLTLVNGLWLRQSSTHKPAWLL